MIYGKMATTTYRIGGLKSCCHALTKSKQALTLHSTFPTVVSQSSQDFLMEALHHRLYLGHTQAHLSATFGLSDFDHFCACALVGATQACAYKYARSSCFSQQLFQSLLGLVHFFFRKAIFRDAFYKIYTKL